MQLIVWNSARSNFVNSVKVFFDSSLETLDSLKDNAYATLAADEGVSLQEALYTMSEMQEQIYDAGAKNFKKMVEIQKDDERIFRQTMENMTNMRQDLLNAFTQNVNFTPEKDQAKKKSSKWKANKSQTPEQEAQIKEFEYKRRLQKISDNRLMMFNCYNLELRYGYDKSTRMKFTPADRPTEFAFRPFLWYKDHLRELIQGYWGAFNSTRDLRNLEEHWNDQNGIQNLKRVGRSVLKDPATGARSAGNLFLAGAKFMENLYFIIEILQTWTDTFQFDEKAKKVKPQKPNYNFYT